MEKRSDKNIVCMKCSRPAARGCSLCAKCLRLDKSAAESTDTLREQVDKLAERMPVNVR